MDIKKITTSSTVTDMTLGTVSDGDDAYLLDATDNAITVTLPPVNRQTGRELRFFVKNPSLRTITINPNASTEYIALGGVADTSAVCTSEYGYVKLVAVTTTVWYAAYSGGFA
jgi:hypothetical protein